VRIASVAVVVEALVEPRLEIVPPPPPAHCVGRPDRDQGVTVNTPRRSEQHLPTVKLDAFVHDIDDSTTAPIHHTSPYTSTDSTHGSAQSRLTWFANLRCVP